MHVETHERVASRSPQRVLSPRSALPQTLTPEPDERLPVLLEHVEAPAGATAEREEPLTPPRVASAPDMKRPAFSQTSWP